MIAHRAINPCTCSGLSEVEFGCLNLFQYVHFAEEPLLSPAIVNTPQGLCPLALPKILSFAEAPVVIKDSDVAANSPGFRIHWLNGMHGVAGQKQVSLIVQSSRADDRKWLQKDSDSNNKQDNIIIH